MSFFRGVGDVDLNLLQDFYIGSRSGTYGKGMYFAMSKDMARVWAVMRYIKKIGIIGEYEIFLPEKTLHIQNPELNQEYNKLFSLYKKDPLLYGKELIKFYENFDAVIDSKEICLKSNSQIKLVSFSIIIHDFADFSASKLFQEFKIGELISEREIINIPPEFAPMLQKWINEH